MTDSPVWNSTLPPGKPLERRKGLERSPFRPVLSGVVPDPVVPLRRTPIKPVSGKRQRENRERRAMADRRWPDRREGTVMCGCGRPECHRRADDLHEIQSRARGGSITDEANCVPLARECHDEITFRPESELSWAYDLGLLRHSWTPDDGGAA